MPVIFIPLSEDIDMMMLKSFLSKVDQKDIKEPPFEKNHRIPRIIKLAKTSKTVILSLLVSSFNG